MPSESILLLQLMQTKGIGPRSVSRVVDQLEQENLSLHDFIGLEPEDMAAHFGLREDQARSIQANEEPASRIAELLDDHGIRTILRPSPAYPERLKTILGDEAPPALFVAGAADLLRRRGVGFCGAREASEEAVRCADQVARALVKHELMVVSGHAAGVDETAHRAALEAGGTTALVLPEGILRFRPRPSIAGLLSDDNAVIVSEFPPKLPWAVANAMQRNRTICGLVHALIVIEAGTTGGTWEAGHAVASSWTPVIRFGLRRSCSVRQG